MSTTGIVPIPALFFANPAAWADKCEIKLFQAAGTDAGIDPSYICKFTSIPTLERLARSEYVTVDPVPGWVTDYKVVPSLCRGLGIYMAALIEDAT